MFEVMLRSCRIQWDLTAPDEIEMVAATFYSACPTSVVGVAAVGVMGVVAFVLS